MNESERTYPAATAAGSHDYKTGKLPESAPLAASYVPFQRNNPPRYDKEEGLIRGTLYPGLDLPFKNKTNTSHPEQNTELGELMELDFALDEMELYLATHEDDKEVFEIYQRYLSEAGESREKFVKKFGPIAQTDMEHSTKYTWLKDPWPWDYTERMD